MILEISLFQKLVLYLGSPTISLSVLLSSLLVGMGTGSYFGKKFHADNHSKRLRNITLLISLTGIAIIFLYPFILSQLLVYEVVIRAAITFILLLPFGFLLGIPFPTCVQMLEETKQGKYIPWMYGVNGAMSVFGSVLAVVLSMLYGFTPAFLVGLFFYLVIAGMLALNSEG